MKFPRTKNIKLVNIPISGKKQSRKIWKIEKLREKNVENLDEKLSDENNPYYPAKIRQYCHAGNNEMLIRIHVSGVIYKGIRYSGVRSLATKQIEKNDDLFCTLPPRGAQSL